MTRTAHVTVNSATVSTAKAIQATARSGPLLVLTERAFLNLVDELGGHEPAMRHLLRVAENVGKPIGLNVSTGTDTSRSMFIAPRSWTPTRLRGWIAVHHEAIEAMFGAAAFVPEGAA
jgi:hypothetical protein